MRGTRVILLCGVVVAACVTQAGAGVVPVARASRMFPSGQVGTKSFMPGGGSDELLGRFADEISGEESDPGAGRARAAATQDSLVTFDDGPAALLRVSGQGTAAVEIERFTADPSVRVSAFTSSFVGVRFRVTDRAEPFFASADFTATDVPRGVTPAAVLFVGSGAANRRFTLSPGAGEQEIRGVLEPGDYFFQAAAVADSETLDASSFDVVFEVGSATAIPLPPAVWSGAAGLIAAVALARSRKVTNA